MTVATSLAFVLRAAFAALAPARLTWGVAVVILLVALGRIADLAYLTVGGRPIAPAGLAAGAWSTDDERQARRAAARDISVMALGTSVASPNLAETERGELRAILDTAYGERIAKEPSSRLSLDSGYRKARESLDALRPRGPAEALGRDIVASFRRMAAAAFAVAPFGVLDAGLDALVRRPFDFVRTAPWFALLAGVPIAAAACVAAGGLSRMAACDAGRGVKLSLADALAFVRRHALRLALVPVLPSAVFALAFALMMLIGVLLRVPVLDVVGGFLYGAVLLLSVLIVIVGVGLIVTWPMTVASVATGDSDSVDAIVRTTAYVLRRPGMTAATIATSLIAVGIGLLVAGGVAWMAASLAGTAVGIGAGAEAGAPVGELGVVMPSRAVPPTAGFTRRIAGGFIDLWELILLLVVQGAAISLVMDAGTRAYLALRFRCDGQDPSAVADA